MFSIFNPCRTVVQTLAVACISFVAHSADAQDKSDVTVQLTAKKVVVSEAKESLVSADKAKPGNVIQYDAAYRNKGSSPVKNLLATVPIPEGLAFVAGTAKPADAQASVDGKNFAPVPLTREVTKPDGTKETQEIPVTEYRALRWSIAELAPGVTTTVSARARVLTNTGNH